MNLDSTELLARMRRFEDHFVERKTASDRKDWLKTIVAFANSTPSGSTAVLFIGVTNSGEIEERQQNLDTIQKTLKKELEKAYPRINCISRVVEKDGREALAVIVPSSTHKPHFAGPSFIRRFSETIEASEQQLSELIARRNSKVSRILDYKGKYVTVMNSHRIGPHISESSWGGVVRVHDCDELSLTLETGGDPKDRSSFPLGQVDVLFDHVQNRLLIKLDR
jgi:hypothetical protein